MQFTGKTAVVTGSGSGIGREVAFALATAGATVGVVDIQEVNAKAVAAEIKVRGGKALAVACDVCERAAVRAMKTEINRVLGPVSLVVANAGVAQFQPFTEMSDDDIDWVIQVNLFGVLNCLQVFLPDMLTAREGHIAATSSFSGLLSPHMVNHAPYVAAKSAVLGLMLSMRRELEGSGVGTTVLCPGGVKTGITNSPQYRPRRYGGPTEGVIVLPSGGGKQQVKFRPPEEAARMLLDAMRDNQAVVVTDGSVKELFRQGYAALMLSAFDRAVEFDAQNGDN